MSSSDAMWNAKAQDVYAIEMKGFTSTVSGRLSRLVVSCLGPSQCCVGLCWFISEIHLKAKNVFDDFCGFFRYESCDKEMRFNI